MMVVMAKRCPFPASWLNLVALATPRLLETRGSPSGDGMASGNDLPKATAMEGNLGLLYVCGEETGGEMTVVETLLGRKVRGVCGAYDRFVALVDAWELEWPGRSNGASSVETQLVAEGLKDVKVHHVAVGKNHRVALSLDGQLFSWGRCGAVLPSSELGHQLGTSNAQNYHRVKKPGPEDDAGTQQLASSRSNQALARPRTTASATGVPHRVVTAPELFFTHVSCGKHHSAAVTDSGDVYTWGRNYEGQLGHVFSTLPKETNAVLNGICAWPKYVGFFLGKPPVLSACCGNTFTVVLLADGGVYLLGAGSLRPASCSSKSSTAFNLLLEKGSNGEPFVGVACGFEHVLAVTSAGEMFSWGLNTFGQLGHGGKTGRGDAEVKGGRALPGKVSCDRAVKWAKVFAGGNYSAAVSTEHQLYTWGNGSHGKLGHGESGKQDCEFVPRRVDYLQRTVVGAVVCADRNLFAFAPTYISRIAPLCGEHTGGYELRIGGSGFWPSDNMTVRFVPLTDGRLLRGTLGSFCEATGEVVCQAPKFRLPGEYAVEVSMNGKHFTSNGRVFTVFRRPQVAAVSVYDARFTGGEELTLSLCGSLPEICRRPLVRFVRCHADENGGQPLLVSGGEPAPAALGVFDEQAEIGEEEEDEEKAERDPSEVTGRLLRVTMPALSNDGDGVVPYTLEISYDGGLMFAPVCVDPTLGKQNEGVDEEEDAVFEHDSHSRKPELPRPASPHVIWAHDAHLVRVSPNSFLTNELPQTVKIELQHLLAPSEAQLLVTIAHSPSKEESDPQRTATALATLSIDSIDHNVLTCTIPPLSEWECRAPSLPAEWWKAYAKAGFVSQLRVSMNAGRTVLPAQLQIGGRSSSSASQVFGMLAPGRLGGLFPNVGMVPGGTQVSIAGDFFHFDTQDAAVKLQWRESSVVVPAMCLRPEGSTGETSAATRRVVFRTPPLPFPNDTATAAAMAEGMVLGTREEVQVFVSLDGEHFAEAALSFVYCAVPEVSGISPPEAEPGTKMVISVDRVISTPAACVKLLTADSAVSVVRVLRLVLSTAVSDSFCCLGGARGDRRGCSHGGVCTAKAADHSR
jgi:alpha-tubulin suppressor-like RCC1 family protein